MTCLQQTPHGLLGTSRHCPFISGRMGNSPIAGVFTLAVCSSRSGVATHIVACNSRANCVGASFRACAGS